MTDQIKPSPVLDVRGLQTVFHDTQGAWPAVDGIDLTLYPGEVLGLVGESGSGKSVAGFSVMGLIDPPGEITAGEVLFRGEDLRKKSEEELRRIRGIALAMIFQNPLSTLNPVLRIGEQMTEVLSEHGHDDPAAAASLAVESLRKVGIPAPEQRIHQYPHELSGGMRQRVAIAIALLGDPAVIIADEPTTALDVTIQGQIIAELQKLQAESGAGMIWITHDLGVVAELADRIAVMYAGNIVEMGPTDAVLDHPRHPYTLGLLASVPGDADPGAPLRQVPGNAPPLSQRPLGCPFHPRCASASDICRRDMPERETDAFGRSYLCHHPVSQKADP